MSEWPNISVCILGSSGPQCGGQDQNHTSLPSDVRKLAHFARVTEKNDAIGGKEQGEGRQQVPQIVIVVKAEDDAFPIGLTALVRLPGLVRHRPRLGRKAKPQVW